MDTENPVVRLCAAGMQCEAEGRHADAAALFQQAWSTRRDAYEACIAAHYVARHQATPADTLRWNEEALHQADAAEPERIAAFLPSLHLNLAHSHEVLGDLDSARDHYRSAESLLSSLPDDDAYSSLVRRGVREGIRRMSEVGSRFPTARTKG